MSYRLIAEDSAVVIYDGGPQPGPPVWGAAVPINAFARRVGKRTRGETTNVRSLGEKRRRLRGTEGSDDIEIELYVQSGAALDIDLLNYVKVEVKANSAWSTAVEFIGLLTDDNWDANLGNAQTQTLTIACDADGVS